MINNLVKWEDIVRANESIKTVDVKGKEYADVNQRIKAFRMIYPEGTIMTELLKLDGGVCVMQAIVKDFDTILGMGTAYEVEGSTFINRTSYIENCETSAVGRALGMAGFGIDTSVASYEEVQTAQLNQELLKPITKTQAKSLTDLAIKKGVNGVEFLAHFGVAKTTDMTAKQYGEAVKWLEEMGEQNEMG